MTTTSGASVHAVAMTLTTIMNKDIANGLALAAIILAITLGFGGCSYLLQKGAALEAEAEAKRDKIEQR